MTLRLLAGVMLSSALAVFTVSCRKTPEAIVQEAGARVQTLVQQGQYDRALAALDAVLKNKRCEAYYPLIRGAILNVNIDKRLAQGDVAGAADFFRGAAAQAPADAAATGLGRIVNFYEKAGRGADADAFCRSVMDSFKENAALRDSACALWVGLAHRRNALPEMVTRLVAAKREGFSAEFLIRAMDPAYAGLLKTLPRDDKARLMDMLQGIVDGSDPEYFRRQAAGMILDLSFFLDRFAVALAILERPDGIAGRDPEWRKLMAVKVRAHLALQQGKPLEAVGHFREFMKIIAAEGKDDLDPVDNTRVTPDMILGLNAKRIGDILSGAGDKVAAAKAYAEARDYYARAQKAFAENSKERQKIDESLKAIP